MYLTEDSPESAKMRENIKNMLTSEYEPNFMVAFNLIQGGGLHIDVFPYIWNVYFKDKNKYAPFLPILEDFIESFFPERLQKFIKDEMETMAKDWWRSNLALFSINYFELLLEEKMATVPQLLHIWKTEEFYHKNTALTHFLLQHKAEIDKNFFLHPYLPTHDLHIPEIARLFEEEDANFDKRALLQRFIVPISKTNRKHYLDLSRTGLKTLPAEVLELKDLEVLDIVGTKITELPFEILDNVKEIYMSNRTKRKVYSYVLRAQNWESPYTHKLAYQKGVLYWKGGKYEKAYQIFQQLTGNLSGKIIGEEEIRDYWEKYIDSAFRCRSLEVCEAILKEAVNRIAYPKVFYWKNWSEYLLNIFCQDKEQVWLGILEQYIHDAPPQKIVYTVHQHLGIMPINPQVGYYQNWRVIFEKAIFKMQVQDALYILGKITNWEAKNAVNWHWTKIFRHLQGKQNYEGIVTLFEYFETRLFFSPDKVGLYNTPIHRALWIWVEALIRVGKLDTAELLCSYHIQYAKQNPRGYIERYFGRLAYQYLTEIYTLQNNLACAEVCRQAFDQLDQRLFANR